MKSARAAILGMVVIGMGASAQGMGCGSSAEKPSTVVDEVDADDPRADAGTPPTTPEEDSGTALPGDPPPTDCSSFAPLAADKAFMATGWMGDLAAVLFVDCTIPRAIPSALGACHAVTYSPPETQGMGWAGIAWQNPASYWEDPPEPFVGYPMPCGAKKISFYAKGAAGGEVVDFWGGNNAYQAKLTGAVLTKEWKQYSMTFNGMPDDNVTVGFGWSMGADAAGGPGGKGTFYLDDIKWE